MAKTIALINMKGGVGKSTLAVNLAWHFVAYTPWLKRVLLVDLDPQFNASQYLLGVDKYTSKVVNPNTPTVWNILEQLTRTPTGGTPKPITPSDAIIPVRTIHGTGGKKGQLDLLASRLELAWSLKQPAQKEGLLAKFLAKVQNDYDLVIIDCAPTESVLTTATYLAANYIVVPVKPEYLSTIGLPLLVRSMNEFHQQYEDHHVELLGVVFNHASDYRPEEMKSKREVKSEAARLGWYVFNAEVTYSRSYPKGAREGSPIFWTSKAQHSRKSNFLSFAQELAGRLQL